MKRNVFDFVNESLFVSTDAVAEEFDITVDEAEIVLGEINEDTELIVKSPKGYWHVPNLDDWTDEALETAATDALGLPETVSTVDVPVAAPVASQNRSESVTEAPSTLAHPDRARENFGDLAQNAPTEQGRAYWQAKLDALG